jgi:hypothetical protein
MVDIKLSHINIFTEYLTNAQLLTAPICNAASVGTLKGVTPSKIRRRGVEVTILSFIIL